MRTSSFNADVRKLQIALVVCAVCQIVAACAGALERRFHDELVSCVDDASTGEEADRCADSTRARWDGGSPR